MGCVCVSSCVGLGVRVIAGSVAREPSFAGGLHRRTQVGKHSKTSSNYYYYYRSIALQHGMSAREHVSMSARELVSTARERVNTSRHGPNYVRTWQGGSTHHPS